MKISTKAAALTAAFLLAVTLTACGDDTGASTGEGSSDQARSQSVDSEPTAPPAKEGGETPDELSAADEEFLAIVHAELPANTVIPDATDEQLLILGEQACAQMDSGTDFSAVDVIEGEEPNGLGVRESSAKIASAAMRVYCPQGY